MTGQGGTGGNAGVGGAGGAGGGPPAPELTGEPLWGRAAGDERGERVEGIAADHEGNIVLVGGFETLVNFGGDADTLVSEGEQDAFVVKLDAAGGHLWSKRFGDALDQIAFAVATDPAGNIVIAGEFEGTINFGGDPGTALTSAGAKDLFIAKLDPAGNHLFSRRAGDALDQAAEAVTVTATGEIVVLGTFDGEIHLGDDPSASHASAGSTNVVVAALDPGGDHLWSKRIGTVDSWQRFRSVAASEGAVYVAGAFAGIVDLDGQSVSSSINRWTGGSEGAGEPVYGVDGLVVRLDAKTGAVTWARPLGGAGEQYAKLVSVDRDGHPVVVGNYDAAFQIASTEIPHAAGGDHDLYLARLDAASGEPLAARGFPAAGDQFVWGLSQDPWGNHVLSGYFEESLALGGAPIAAGEPASADAFVAKLSPDFSGEIWSRVYRDQSYCYVTAQAVTGSGATVAAGVFHGERLDLGGELPLLQHSEPARTLDNGDIFLVTLSP